MKVSSFLNRAIPYACVQARALCVAAAIRVGACGSSRILRRRYPPTIPALARRRSSVLTKSQIERARRRSSNHGREPRKAQPCVECFFLTGTFRLGSDCSQRGTRRPPSIPALAPRRSSVLTSAGAARRRSSNHGRGPRKRSDASSAFFERGPPATSRASMLLTARRPYPQSYDLDRAPGPVHPGIFTKSGLGRHRMARWLFCAMVPGYGRSRGCL
jgi:hypothetical protein